MSRKSTHLLSRREALAGSGAAVAYGVGGSNSVVAEPNPKVRQPRIAAARFFPPQVRMQSFTEPLWGYPVPDAAWARLRGSGENVYRSELLEYDAIAPVTAR